MTRICITGGVEQDITGDFALKRLEVEYMKARNDDRPQCDVDDIREAICLARGWAFER